MQVFFVTFFCRIALSRQKFRPAFLDFPARGVYNTG